MEFRKYQHIERFGTEEVEGIELGQTIVFPKLDGTNGSAWLGDDGLVRAGSRNRELSLDNDNQGFCAYILGDERIKEFFNDYPNLRLYGEWLVPHSFKGYREDAWRKFWIFDVCADVEEEVEYMSYDQYSPMLEEYGLDYILPLCKIKNGDYENYLKLLEKNVFLVEDGKGIGEGIVIKNYDYHNRYGRQTWAKIVANEFKEKNAKVFGINELKAKKMIEEEIVNNYLTKAFIEKEHAKIIISHEGWQSKYIPELLGRVFSEFVKEEIWNIVKEYKLPRINFKTLNTLVVGKIKESKPEIFS